MGGVVGLSFDSDVGIERNYCIFDTQHRDFNIHCSPIRSMAGPSPFLFKR
jgi:hypothetical protein